MRERLFLSEHISRGGVPGSIGLAWAAAFPEKAESKTGVACAKAGSSLLSRLQKDGTFAEMLELVGLGDTRLMREVDERLKATKTQGYVYRGEITERVYEDNATRTEGTKLLAKLLGRDVVKVDATVRAVHAVVQVPAELSMEEWLERVGAAPPEPRVVLETGDG